MGDAISTLLQLMLTALGALPLPDTALAGGVFAVAAALIAVAVLALLVSAAAPRSGIRSSTRPGGVRDVSVLLAQSHPDADGHRRPRAPGLAPAA